MSAVSKDPVIGIVIPSFRNPVLLEEAISSVLSQPDGVPATTIVVNDGCPMKETGEVIHSFVTACPGRILGIHTSHGGESAARNRGAALLLRRYPSIEAICFLEAANRLQPTAFHSFKRILEAYPEYDWFHSSLAMFGLNGSGAGRSLRDLATGSFRQTGCLVRRRVFEGGVCFDETMELAAGKTGFRGKVVSESFLQLRNRPGNPSLIDQEISNFKHSKYPTETRVVFSDSERVISFTDPHEAGRVIARSELVRNVWESIASPEDLSIGACWIVVAESRWKELEASGMIRFVLWDIGRRITRISGCAAASVKLGWIPDGEIALGETETISDEGSLAGSDLVAMGTNALRQAVSAADEPSVESIFFPDNGKGGKGFVSRRELRSDCFPEKTSDFNLVESMLSMIRLMRSGDLRDCHAGRMDFRPKPETVGTGMSYPYAPAGPAPLSVCFLLPIAQFGGVETIALNLAIAMRARGWRTAICIIGTNPIRMADDLRKGFDEILWFPERMLLKWSDKSYGGTRLCLGAEGETSDDLVGLLASFGAVMGCHPSGAVSVFGRLRKKGVVTALHEHVMEVGQFQRTFGPPMLALAHEESVDFIATGSIGISHWLKAQGVPGSKIVPIPNAAGFAVSEERRLEILKSRRDRERGPLRCLFIGRLDWQKGMDRLVELIRKTKAGGLDVIWRVVGKPVIDDDSEGLRILRDEVVIEDAVYGTEPRIGVYGWADVVILPSRFEGLPLTVLEARQLGAVPIMTRVGDFGEAIENGFNGVLVDEETCVGEMASVIERFEKNRDELARISENASRTVHSWAQASSEFEKRLRAEVEKRGPGCSKSHA